MGRADLLGLTSLSNDEIIVQRDISYITSPGYDPDYKGPTEFHPADAEPFVKVMCSALD